MVKDFCLHKSKFQEFSGTQSISMHIFMEVSLISMGHRVHKEGLEE